MGLTQLSAREEKAGFTDQCTPDRKFTTGNRRWALARGASLRECRWDARGGHIDGSMRCLSMVSFMRNKGCISCI